MVKHGLDPTQDEGRIRLEETELRLRREAGELHPEERIRRRRALEPGVGEDGHAQTLGLPSVQKREGEHVVLELVEALRDHRTGGAGQLAADLVVPHRGGRVRGRGL